MNLFAVFLALFVILALLVTAVVQLALAARLRKQSGLPQGELIYTDASGLVQEALYSKRLELAGKPDYLLQDRDDNLIPVEVKSGYAPRDGQPHRSHLMQLAAYLFLVEDVWQRPVPYGLIRYRDRTLQITNSDELRESFMDVREQMRTLLAQGAAHRSHEQARRCAACSMAHACDERLA